MSDGADRAGPDLTALHARRGQKWAGHQSDVLVSTIAEMDFPLAEPVVDALHAAVERGDLGYAPAKISTLAEAFAGFARRRMEWTVAPEQVWLVPDVMVGLVELCRVLAGADGAVAFATPAYPPFFTEFAQAGLPTRHVPLLADGALDLERLEVELASGVRVLALVNPHNPTGRVAPREELEQVAELCAAHKAWVVSDEIHAPLVVSGAAPTPWLEVSDAARQWGITLTSASKTFNLAGLKAALVVTGSGPAQDVVRRLPHLSVRAGLLGVLASEAAFAEGDPWLDAVLAQLRHNRMLLGDRLAAELPQIAWTPPQATYLAWLDCRGLGFDGDPAARFLARGRVALSPGPDYGLSGAGFVRLNFGTSAELVADTVSRMATAAEASDRP